MNLNYVMRTKIAKYDLSKMPVVLSVSGGNVYYVKSGIIDKPEDLAKAKGIIFGTDPGAGAMQFVIAKEMLGFPVDKVATGYTGTGDARRAFLAGETNAAQDTVASFYETVRGYAERGEVVLLFQSGISEKGDVVKDPALPANILTFKELHERMMGKPPSGMAYDAYKAITAAARTFYRTLHLPPGTPDSVVSTYWDAAGRMLKDPEYVKMAASLMTDKAFWLTGEAADKAFKQNALPMDPAVVDWLKTTMAKYGMVIE